MRVLLAFAMVVSMMVVGVVPVGADGPTIIPGAPPSSWVQKVAVRYKNFANTGDREIYVGVPDLGVAGNRAERDHTWGNPNDVKFSYDRQNAKANAGGGIEIGKEVGDVGPLNFIVIHVVATSTSTNETATVTLKDIEVKVGNQVVSLSETFSTTAGTDRVWNTWVVTNLGVDLTQGFTITGTIELSGPLRGGENSKVEIAVGGPAVLEVEADKLSTCDKDITLTVSLSGATGYGWLYGYQFELTYPQGIVDASGSFVNTWFNTTSNASVPSGWNAACENGVCRFAAARTDRNQLSGGGAVAQVVLRPKKAGTEQVQIRADVLSDMEGMENDGVPHVVVGVPLTITTECNFCTLSGTVNMQGRYTPKDDTGQVYLNSDLGSWSVKFGRDDGSWSVQVPYKPSDTQYTIDAWHDLYLWNQKTITLSGTNSASCTCSVGTTKLRGGDVTGTGGTYNSADQNNLVDASDLSYIGSRFNKPRNEWVPGDSRADINADNNINILDLSIAGSNYGKTAPGSW
jgi:hypothetical protein